MAGYIGTTPVPQATQHRESFTATGGQTSFATAGYTPQFIDVYLNGVKLAPADFTATNGSDVVLASGATASDILEIVAYTPFEVANQTFTGDTSVTNLAVTGTFTSRGIDDNADAVAITIDSSENVGIGTTSPATLFHLNSASDTYFTIGTTNATADARIQFRNSSGTDAGGLWYATNSNSMQFRTNSAERMRIDSSGNVGIGTSSPSDALHVLDSSGNAYASIARGTQSQGEVGLRLRGGTSGNDWYVYQKTSSNNLNFYNTADRMTIDSSGNVGIGTSSPARTLHLNGSDSDTVQLHITNATTGSTSNDGFSIALGSDESGILNMREANPIRFFTSDTERMRIDSSGNVLVGKTTQDDAATAGITLAANNTIYAARSGAAPLLLNRLSSDGGIVVLRKDGTTRGNIGIQSGDILYVATSDNAGQKYDGDNQRIDPCNSDGTTNDNSLDLGGASSRFKDLYLSGGVYLGGTGSANKLEDYEEGTWTPAPTVGTVSSASGNYTKIGRLVHVTAYVGGFSNTTNNEVLIITGLPFTGGVNSAVSGNAMWQFVNIDFGYQIVYYDGSNQLRFYHTTNGSFDPIRHIDLDGSSTEVYLSATYAAT